MDGGGSFSVYSTALFRIDRIPSAKSINCLGGLPDLVNFADMDDKASRNEQIYQAVRVYKYTLKEVADVLGLYYSTISVIAKRVDEEKKHQE